MKCNNKLRLHGCKVCFIVVNVMGSLVVSGTLVRQGQYKLYNNVLFFIELES